MRSLKQSVIVFCYSNFFMSMLCGYNLPSINLGQTNILDGGPLRAKSGWYWKEYLHYYHSDKFLDGKGQRLGRIPSPHFDSLAIITQFIYQSKGGYWTFSSSLPKAQKGYNLRSANKIIINEPGAYRYYAEHKVKYANAASNASVQKDDKEKKNKQLISTEKKSG